MIRMTRFDLDIAGAVKKAKEIGYVGVIIRAKTKENYIYTIRDCRFETENYSEKELFNNILHALTCELEEIRKTMLTDKILYVYEEGRILNADNIKEVWCEFGVCECANIPLEEKQSIK